MHPSTEEFLYFLLWTAESLSTPTWRNLHDGFESWAWRRGLGPRVTELARLKLVETLPGTNTNAVIRLTATGKQCALGGRDPDEAWSRRWDGRWRMVLFDIPVRQESVRYRLWRWLRANGFGFLQNSVWITPDPFDRSRLSGTGVAPEVESMILVEGRPCGDESDQAMVLGAWDFGKINEVYGRCFDILARRPTKVNQFRQWAALERRTWTDAMKLDPFLPAELLPKDYIGRTAWARRKQVIAQLAVRGGAAPL